MRGKETAIVDIEYAKSLSLKTIQKRYKNHLQSLEISKNTVDTYSVDTFYLWNNGGKDLFWDTVLADDFEATASNALTEVLTKNSSGNVEKLINGYVSRLRDFRDFLIDSDIDKSKKEALAELKKFLLDIECLDPLAEWTSKFNLFDILVRRL